MADVWNDYDNFITYAVPRLTVAKLRQLADKIYQVAHINLQLKSQERKSDLVDKIRGACNTLHRANRSQEYTAIRREYEELVSAGRPSAYIPPPTFGGVPTSAYAGPSRQPTAAYPNGTAGGWNAVPPRYGGSSGLFNATNYGTQNRAATAPVLQDWKASPLWKPIRALTNMEMLPDIQSSESSSTRRERRVTFTLPNDIIELLNKSKNDPRSRPVYSVRLFAASSEHYKPPGAMSLPGAPPITNRQIPIEYPANPDCSVDDHPVPFKERGLRGKAGSAPPVDLDKSNRGLIRIAGRMASCTMGHTGPTVSKRKEITKRFWFQVAFCEITPMEDLLERLQNLVPTDAAAERAKLREQDDDDDIQVGPSHLSLKDPLSGMRISKPVRSSKCSHLQCFDARWWLEANKSHPQWLCPHCSKELKFDEVICDGYFLSILNTVPDDYEEVVLESNGDWHTADGKYGSAEWLAANAPAAPEPVTVKRQRSESMERTPAKAKRATIEILSDSSDEEPLANSRANGNGRASGSASASVPPGKRPEPPVIDLTLSDSDDDGSEDEQPLRFHKPGVASATRDVAASQPRPAEIPASSKVSATRDLPVPPPRPNPNPTPTASLNANGPQPRPNPNPSFTSQPPPPAHPNPSPPNPSQNRYPTPSHDAAARRAAAIAAASLRGVLPPAPAPNGLTSPAGSTGPLSSPPSQNEPLFSDTLRNFLDTHRPGSRALPPMPGRSNGVPSQSGPAPVPSGAHAPLPARPTYPSHPNGH